MKKPERILIVSDSVKKTTVNGKGRAITDARGGLLGGSMTVTAAVRHLIRLGFDERTVWKTVTTNPAQYLRP
jgi:N-acetylglucosamine-6-phosphate deacetylase